MSFFFFFFYFLAVAVLERGPWNTSPAIAWTLASYAGLMLNMYRKH